MYKNVYQNYKEEENDMRIKKLLIISLFTVVLVSFASMVIATGSGYIDSPTMEKFSTEYNSDDYACYIAAQYVCGTDTYTYFRNYGEVPAACAADSSRTLEINLYENDPWPLANDLVKSYLGTYSGRQLYSINHQSTYIVDEIEYDNKAELYISALVTKCINDPDKLILGSGHFQFNVGVY